MGSSPLFKNIENTMLSAHFAENLGYLSFPPIAGNLFSVMFGRNLDAHRSTPLHDVLLNPPPLPPPIHVYSALPQCLLGLNCYVDTIYFTMLATFLAILLSIWAGYRDKLKIAIAQDKTCW